MSIVQEKVFGQVVCKKFNIDFYVIDKFFEIVWLFYVKFDDESKKEGVCVINVYDFFICGQEVLFGGQCIYDFVEFEECIKVKGVDFKSGGIKEYFVVFQQVGVLLYGGGGIGLDCVVVWFLVFLSVYFVVCYFCILKRLLL